MSSVISTAIGRGRLMGGSWLRLFGASDTISLNHSWLWLNTNMVSWQWLTAYHSRGMTAKAASGPLTETGPPPTITFDRFIRACVTVKTLTDSFKRYARLRIHCNRWALSWVIYSLDVDKDGWVRINYEQFITVSGYLPFTNLTMTLNSSYWKHHNEHRIAPYWLTSLWSMCRVI